MFTLQTWVVIDLIKLSARKQISVFPKISNYSFEKLSHRGTPVVTVVLISYLDDNHGFFFLWYCIMSLLLWEKALFTSLTVVSVDITDPYVSTFEHTEGYLKQEPARFYTADLLLNCSQLCRWSQVLFFRLMILPFIFIFQLLVLCFLFLPIIPVHSRFPVQFFFCLYISDVRCMWRLPCLWISTMSF